MTATIGPPSQHGITHHADGRKSFEVPVSVQITRRARLWARWGMLRGRWPSDAAADA
ncbi:hypothetical protein ACPCAJ_21090 [Streptomyces griseoincarnatus]